MPSIGLLHDEHAVDAECRPRQQLEAAVGPANLEAVDARRAAQPEVEAIVHG